MEEKFEALVSKAFHSRIGLGTQLETIYNWLELRSNWQIKLTESGTGFSYLIGLQDLSSSKELRSLVVLNESYRKSESDIGNVFLNPSVALTYSPRVGHLLLKALMWPCLQKDAREMILQLQKEGGICQFSDFEDPKTSSFAYTCPDTVVSLALAQLDMIIAESQELKLRAHYPEFRDLPLELFPLAQTPPQLAIKRVLTYVENAITTNLTDASKVDLLDFIQAQLIKDLNEDRRGLSKLLEPKVFSFCCDCKDSTSQTIFVLVAPVPASKPKLQDSSGLFDDFSPARLDCKVYELPAGDPYRKLSLSSELHRIICEVTRNIWEHESSEHSDSVWQDSNFTSLDIESARDSMSQRVLNSFSKRILTLARLRHPTIEHVIEALDPLRIKDCCEHPEKNSAQEYIINIFYELEKSSGEIAKLDEGQIDRISDWLASFAIFENGLSVGQFLESVPLWVAASKIRPIEHSILLYGQSEDFEELLDNRLNCSLDNPLSFNLLFYGLTQNGAQNLEILLSEDLIYIDAINADALSALNNLSLEDIISKMRSDVSWPLFQRKVDPSWLFAIESGNEALYKLRMSAGFWSQMNKHS